MPVETIIPPAFGYHGAGKNSMAVPSGMMRTLATGAAGSAGANQTNINAVLID